MATGPPRVTNLVHIKHYEIMDSQLRPEPLYQTRHDHGRSATRGVTTSSSARAHSLEGEEPTPCGEGGWCVRRHEEISSVTAPPITTVLPADEFILANTGEPERWDAYNIKIFSVLFLFTKDAANSFLVRLAGRPDSRQQSDGQAAWKTMAKIYLISSMQRRLILMRKLNGMVMRSNQDQGEHITKVFQQRDKLEHIGESFTKACILDRIVEGLSDEYESVRFAAERDLDISLKQIEITMHNMYTNRIARSGGSTFLRWKGRESAMTVSLGFKGSYDYNNTPGHKKAQCFKFLRKSGAGSSPSSGAARMTWWVHIKRTFTMTPITAPNSNSVAAAGAATTPVAKTTGATATDAITAVALTRARLTRHSFGCSRHSCPGCSSYCPVCSGYCSACSCYCPAYSSYSPRCFYAVQRHRAASIGHRPLVPRRFHYSGPAEVHHGFGLRGVVTLRRQPLYRIEDEGYREAQTTGDDRRCRSESAWAPSPFTSSTPKAFSTR